MTAQKANAYTRMITPLLTNNELKFRPSKNILPQNIQYDMFCLYPPPPGIEKSSEKANKNGDNIAFVFPHENIISNQGAVLMKIQRAVSFLPITICHGASYFSATIFDQLSLIFKTLVPS